jgi:hypothetical protein
MAIRVLVLAERSEQVAERLDGDIELADGGPERDEDGMRGRAGVAAVKLVLPGAEQDKGPGRIAGFIAEIVGPAAIGVNACEMRSKAGRKKPRDDVEIFIVVAGEPANILEGLGFGAAWERERARNLEAGIEQNRRGVYGITATLSSPLRCFMRSKMAGSSRREISLVMKSRGRISPRAMASRAARM